ncbi:MAG: polymerase subunit epsilon [Nocardioidaceae bacterium]|nr:polymerase subunit epsilon [Nocardioidaceae bacterium]
MRSNRQSSRCDDCGTEVPVGAGVLLGPAGGWFTYCALHTPTAPVPTHPGAWEVPGLASLDLETTGVDPQQDRIVSIGLLDETGREYTMIVNPGVPIPAGAAAVHGMSDADVADKPAAIDGVRWVVSWLEVAIARQVPVVVYNAPYDLTMVSAEAARHGIPQPDWDKLWVVDPMVLDWGLEHGRFGPRKLTDMCAFYRVVLDDAHDALADARSARLVAFEMASRHGEFALANFHDLMDHQRKWFAERTEDWNAWITKKGRPAEDPHAWPLIRTAG